MINKEDKDNIERKAHDAITRATSESPVSTPTICLQTQSGDVYNITQSVESGDIVNDNKPEVIKLKTEIRLLQKLIKSKDEQITLLEGTIELLKKKI